MPRIFISYRRADSAGYAGRLYDHLCKRLGENALFMDIDAIPPGDDFVQVIQDAIDSCDTVLVLIGPHWLSATDAQGNCRLDDPNDLVRLEVATALRRNIRVIPVLLNNTPMPFAFELPADLQPLLRRNAIEISDQRFVYDAERLATLLFDSQLHTPSQTPYHLSNVRQQTSFRRHWFIATTAAAIWCVIALVLYWSAWKPGEELPNNLLVSVTWAVLLPVVLAILTVLWPLKPHDAGIWAFLLHSGYSVLMWGTDAYHDYQNAMNNTTRLSLLDLAVYGGFVLIPSALVGGVASIISWERHRRSLHLSH